jgi:hypothetical protein
MDLRRRIARLRLNEHARLVELLPVVDERVHAQLSQKPPSVVPGRGPAPKVPRAWDPRRLQLAWQPFHDLLEQHLERDSEVFDRFELFATTKDPAVRDELADAVESQQVEHALLRRLGGEVRIETVSENVPVLREVVALMRVLDEHLLVEEREIFPGFDTGRAITRPDETAEIILKNLRTAVPAMERRPPPEAPPGLWERLRRIFRQD